MTADVDVTVSLGDDEPLSFVNGMEEEGFTIRGTGIEEFVRRTRVLPFVHQASGVPVDVVLAGPGPEEEFLARAVTVETGTSSIQVICPEDLVVTKVLAGRPKDLEDVRSVLRTQGARLELTRIRTLLAALEEALGESDLTPLFERQLEETLRARKPW